MLVVHATTPVGPKHIKFTKLCKWLAKSWLQEKNKLHFTYSWNLQNLMKYESWTQYITSSKHYSYYIKFLLILHSLYVFLLSDKTSKAIKGFPEFKRYYLWVAKFVAIIILFQNSTFILKELCNRIILAFFCG